MDMDMAHGTWHMAHGHGHGMAHAWRMQMHAPHALSRRAGPSTPLYLLHDTPQGLSRFASDIIIRGFDTPCKLGFYDGNLLAENLD